MGTKLKHAQLWLNIKGEIVLCCIQEINTDIENIYVPRSDLCKVSVKAQVSVAEVLIEDGGRENE